MVGTWRRPHLGKIGPRRGAGGGRRGWPADRSHGINQRAAITTGGRRPPDRYRQIQTDTDRYRQIQTDTDRYRQIQTDTLQGQVLIPQTHICRSRTRTDRYRYR